MLWRGKDVEVYRTPEGKGEKKEADAVEFCLLVFASHFVTGMEKKELNSTFIRAKEGGEKKKGD